MAIFPIPSTQNSDGRAASSKPPALTTSRSCSGTTTPPPPINTSLRRTTALAYAPATSSSVSISNGGLAENAEPACDPVRPSLPGVVRPRGQFRSRRQIQWQLMAPSRGEQCGLELSQSWSREPCKARHRDDLLALRGKSRQENRVRRPPSGQRGPPINSQRAGKPLDSGEITEPRRKTGIDFRNLRGGERVGIAGRRQPFDHPPYLDDVRPDKSAERRLVGNDEGKVDCSPCRESFAMKQLHGWPLRPDREEMCGEDQRHRDPRDARASNCEEGQDRTDREVDADGRVARFERLREGQFQAAGSRGSRRHPRVERERDPDRGRSAARAPRDHQ